jgi:biopolymer transport protein ExbD
MPKVLPASNVGPGHRARGRRVSTTLAEINVIPLVDVMLVLLIIFMVAAPMLQRGVEVSLPQARQSAPLASEPVFVDVPMSFSKDRRVFISDKESIRIDALAERMRQRFLNRSDKRVFVRADNRLQVQALIDVLDALKAGGIENAGIVTDFPEQR